MKVTLEAIPGCFSLCLRVNMRGRERRIPLAHHQLGELLARTHPLAMDGNSKRVANVMWRTALELMGYSLLG